MDSEPKTTPFEALGWKFQPGELVRHKADWFATGLVIARVALQSVESAPDFWRSYIVRTGLVSPIQVDEGELVRMTKESESFKEDPAESSGGDSGATGE